MALKKVLTDIVTSGTFDRLDFDIKRKVVIINSLLLIAIPILTGYIIYTFSQGAMKFFFIDLAILAVDMVLLVILRKTLKVTLIAHVMTLVLAAVLFNMYISGGHDKTGPIFSLLFPVVVLYLYGLKKGSIIVILYLLVITISTALFYGNPWFPRYDYFALYRFATIFLFIFLCSLIYGYVVEWTMRQMKEAVTFRDKFISILAHDLKGPMGTYHDIAAYITENYKSLSENEFEEMMQALRTSSENNYNLLINLLQWSMVKGNMITHNPAAIHLKSMTAAIAVIYGVNLKQKRLVLNMKIDDSMMIHADENMLSMVMRNLLSNAIKYSRDDGSITIASWTEGNNAVIKVSDSGMGMSKNTYGMLFRNKDYISVPGSGGESGTALGLVLCREFVERNGGTIWAESREGEGSDFFFTTPLSQAGKQGPQDNPAGSR